MLAITPTAAEAIKGVLSSSGLEPHIAGLRIASAQSTPERGPGFELTLAPVPASEDEVIEEGGAHVFLEPAAADALDDRVLDAEVEAGQARFAIVSEQ